MKIKIDRKWKKEKYTIGRLYINDQLFCNTLEDADRGLTQDMSLAKIISKKIYGKTAIPAGTYNITLNVRSPKFSKYNFYKETCDGYLPRLLDVPGFSGILIHVGSDESNTSGCILIGYNTIKGKLTDGKKAFAKLYEKMQEACDKGEEIIITIK